MDHNLQGMFLINNNTRETNKRFIEIIVKINIPYLKLGELGWFPAREDFII